MFHQSDWGYYKQPIKLLLGKVKHVGRDFILILEGPSKKNMIIAGNRIRPCQIGSCYKMS